MCGVVCIRNYYIIILIYIIIDESDDEYIRGNSAFVGLVSPPEDACKARNAPF